MEHIIDATGKKLGRVCSDAAAILRGKSDTGFAPNKVSDVKVNEGVTDADFK